MEWNGQMMPELNNSVRCPSVRFLLIIIYLYYYYFAAKNLLCRVHLYHIHCRALKQRLSLARISLERWQQDTTHHVTTKLLQSSGAGGVWQHQLGHSINTQDATTGVDKTLRYHSSFSDISGIDDCKIISPK